MNKKISVFIILIMLAVLLLGSASYGVAIKLFSMTSGSGSPNQEVTIYINLDKSIAFASADLTLEYDTSKLEYVNYTALAVLNTASMNIVKNNSDTGKIAIGYVSNPSSANQIKSAGQLISITFKIKPNASGTANLTLNCTSLKNDEGNNTSVSTETSTITIKGSQQPSNNTPTNNTPTNNTPVNNNSNNGNNRYDNTQASGRLPQTGLNRTIIIISIIILIPFTIYIYNKYLYFKEF